MLHPLPPNNNAEIKIQKNQPQKEKKGKDQDQKAKGKNQAEPQQDQLQQKVTSLPPLKNKVVVKEVIPLQEKKELPKVVESQEIFLITPHLKEELPPNLVKKRLQLVKLKKVQVTLNLLHQLI